MQREIKIILGKDGSISAEGENFVGPECEKAMAFLDKLFGEAATKTQKDSYFLLNTDAHDCLGNGFCG